MKSSGIFKRVVFKKNPNAWGELAGSSGGTIMRRVKADFNPTAASYSSNEINTSRQMQDTRLGVRGVDASVGGELSPGTYAGFIEHLLSKDFASVVGASGVSVTIAASGTNFTITRASGSWITDGIKVGQVVRMTGAGLNAANVGNNCLVVSETATVLTVQVLSSVSLVAEGPIASVSVAPAGKVSYVPASGHTDTDFTVEEWYSDIQKSHVYTGIKASSANIKVPSTGIATVDFAMQGKGLTSKGTSAYFTSPSAASTTGLCTAVRGSLLINGAVAACITDANINLKKTLENAQCLGSNFNSDILTGKIEASGSLSAYFSDNTLLDYFDAETEVSIVLAITSSEAKNADFVTVVLPRVKFTKFTNADKETAIMSNLDFTALENSVTSTGLIDSTIMIQDSAA